MGYDELLLIGNREKRGGPTIASGAPAAALTMLQREEISGNLNFVVLYIYLFRVDGIRKKKGSRNVFVFVQGRRRRRGRL
jgi:hypothetical protein